MIRIFLLNSELSGNMEIRVFKIWCKWMHAQFNLKKNVMKRVEDSS